jgi:ribosome-associated translation inhibitor RaiA
MMEVAVTAKGNVPDSERDHARERVSALDHCVSDPVLGARVTLRFERNRRLTRPARAEAELNVNGHMLRGHVAGETMSKAIEQLGSHLERQLHGFADRRDRLERRASVSQPGEWHHGAASPPRPDFRPRPVKDRAIVRRKSFVLGVTDPLGAIRDLLDLDHEFYLFHDAETDTDAVVYHRDDGRIGLIYPDATRPPRAGEGPVYELSRLSEPITLETAIAQMDAISHRFIFFINAESARGSIIYLRYDGNYGLIEPAD